MSRIAEYARIFETSTTDEWVQKRKNAVASIKGWLETYSPEQAITIASTIAASFGYEAQLPDEIATRAERIIQEHAESFVRSSHQGELQIKVLIAAAAIDVISDTPSESSWASADALAAAFWSALWFQPPLEEAKVEALRQDLLHVSRSRVRRVADAARKRHPVPPVGHVNIDQNSADGTKVNNAFSRAVQPMLTALQENSALDREELDFLWWLLSDRSEILDEPFADLPVHVRAVVAGFDAAAKLRRLPADAHRNIVLRNIAGGESVTLTELVEELGSRRSKLAASLGTVITHAADVFPLIIAIKTGTSDARFASEKITASEWGARALLEGAIHHLQASTTGGL